MLAIVGSRGYESIERFRNRIPITIGVRRLREELETSSVVTMRS